MKYIFSILFLVITLEAKANCKLYLLAGSYDKAVHAAQEKQKFGKATISDINCQGQAYFELGKFSLAAEQFVKVASLATSDIDRSAAYQGAGMSMLYTGDYNRGIEFLEKKLKIDKKLGDKNEVGVSLATMAAILGNMGNHKEAIVKSIEALNYLKHDTDIASTYNNIANEYAGMGDIDNAIKYMQKAIELDRKFFGDKKDLAIHLVNLGNFYLVKEKDKKAIEALNEGVQLIRKFGDLYWLMTGLTYRAKAYFYAGQANESKSDIDEALKIALNINPREIDSVKSLHASLTQAIKNSNN